MSEPRDPPFHDLRVFQDGLVLAERVYRLTVPFPREERYGLTSQLRRAAVSVVANVAEGRARFGPRNLVQFLDIAHGSLREVQALLLLASSLGYLPESERVALDAHVTLLAAQLLTFAQWARVRAKRRKQ